MYTELYKEIYGVEPASWTEGFDVGMAKGRTEGRAEGRAEGEINGLRTILDNGIRQGLFHDYKSGLAFFNMPREDYPGLF